MSYQRELDTYNQCNEILLAIDSLKRLIAKGPRLTVKKEAEFAAALKEMKSVFRDLKDHSYRNL